MIDIVQALDDPNLFGPWFSGPSWATWKAVLKGAFCIREGEIKLFRDVAQRDPPKRRVRELWAVVGRRGGKDSVASAVACFASGFINYRKVLRPGERASVLCLAVDKAQAGIVEKYTRAYFADIPLLRGQVKRETADGLELTTGAELDVLASNFRNVRGRSIACVVMDEVAFWRSETTANPDVETY
jgi:phage terminase large subunit-like protein